MVSARVGHALEKLNKHVSAFREVASHSSQGISMELCHDNLHHVGHDTTTELRQRKRVGWEWMECR